MSPEQDPQQRVLDRLDIAVEQLRSVVIDVRKVMREKKANQTGGNEKDAEHG